MKKILVIVTNFRHGGISKSLQNLSSIIDKEKYSIDVFAMEHYGPYKTMLPNCNILNSDIWLESLVTNWNERRGIAKLRSIMTKSCDRLLKYIGFDLTNFIFKQAAKKISKYKYETIIAFSEGVPTIFASHLPSQNKIAWVRCDYDSYMRLNNYPNETEIYNSYNSVVCVSEYTRLGFCKHIPSMAGKTYSIYNVLDTSMMLNVAKDNIDDNFFTNGQFNIVSIGGINVVKRFSKIPQIVRILIDRGCIFKWYLIGSTMQIQEQKELDKNISKYDVSNFFIPLGSKDNPYPYIAQCDLLVNTSISEAAPNVVNEAKILNTPVVCSNFGSASEFIDDGVNGYIVPIENMAEKIELLIKDKQAYDNIKKGVHGYVYHNEQILQKVYRLLDKY